MKKKIKLSAPEYIVIHMILLLIDPNGKYVEDKENSVATAIQLASKRFKGTQRDYIIKLINENNYEELNSYLNESKLNGSRRECDCLIKLINENNYEELNSYIDTMKSTYHISDYAIKNICIFIIGSAIGIPLAKAIKNRI